MTLHTIILTTGISAFGARKPAGTALRQPESLVCFREGEFQPDLPGIKPKDEESFSPTRP